MRTIFYIAPTCLSRHLWGAYTKPQFLENVQHMYVCMFIATYFTVGMFYGNSDLS